MSRETPSTAAPAKPTANDEFVLPRWEEPLDTEARLARVPPRATVKGMFFTAAIDAAARAIGRPPPGFVRYIPFKDYPLADHLRVLCACAKLAHPKLPPREGLRRLGQEGYRTFVQSLAGRALFAVAGRNWEAALRLLSRAYDITGPVGSGEVTQVTPTQVRIALRGIWNYPDSYHVGVIEAAMEQFGKAGEIRLRMRDLADMDLEIRIRS